MRISNWDQCDADARHLHDNGHETVVVCNRQRHAAPGDATATHHDSALNIYWRYADGDVRYDG